MKIDKAIETLQDILRYVKPGDPPDEHDAIQLGLEALNRVKYARNHPSGWELEPLPGEEAESD